MSQHVYGEAQLNYALASVPVLYGVIPVMLVPITRRLYVRHMERLDVR